MHKYERIAIWVFITLIIVYMFVTNRASMYSRYPRSFFALREFQKLPPNLGDAMSDTVLRFVNILSSEYKKLSPDDQTYIINNIKSPTDDQLLSLVSGPPTESKPMRTARPGAMPTMPGAMPGRG
jgi:hypothetical protein